MFDPSLKIRCLTYMQANVVFANELGRRYADQGIVSTSLHPGNLKSDLQRHISPFIRGVMVYILPLTLCSFANNRTDL